MCVNYIPPTAEELIRVFGVMNISDTWPHESFQDYAAPIIRTGPDGKRVGMIASYGMVPKRHVPPAIKRLTTMNARSETVGQLRSYAPAWKALQLCLVPMQAFFEPNYEAGSHVRWRIGMADESPFAVAGLWRTWKESDGTESHSFTQLTINADQHPLLNRFQTPGDEKRSLVIIAPDAYDDWLSCRDPELARSFLQPYPAQKMDAKAAPKIAKPKRPPPDDAAPTSGQLF